MLNTTNELYHHGVKGMKWGVRKDRYTQRKSFKRFKRVYNRDKTRGNPYRLSDEGKRIINDQVRQKISKEDINRIKAAKNRWLELDRKTPVFEDTKEFEVADKRAYNKTLNWFRKNDSEYLKSIIKENKGKTSNLDMYHDFRKIYEGYQDNEWGEAERNWNKAHGQQLKEVDKAYMEYKSACEKVGNRVLGDYGNKKIGLDKYDPSYNTVVNFNIDWDAIIKK